MHFIFITVKLMSLPIVNNQFHNYKNYITDLEK